MNDKISIIIPVYNSEKYLNRCVDSVIGSTYQNLEILLVDDGSSDLSGKICDEYAKKDPRIRVFHTQNRGAAMAKNLGLDNATGDYVGFVDSDDYIENDMYETLYNSLTENSADISVCGHYKISGEKCSEINAGGKTEVFTKEQAIYETVYLRKMYNYLCDKLFKKSVIADIRIPDLKIGEDRVFLFNALIRSDKIVSCGKVGYYYTDNPDSLTKSNISVEKMYDGFYKSFLYRREYIKNNVPEAYAENDRLIYTNAVNIINTIIRTNEYKNKYKEIYNELVCEIRKNKKEILSNPLIGKPVKLHTAAVSVNKVLQRFICRLNINKLLRK